MEYSEKYFKKELAARKSEDFLKYQNTTLPEIFIDTLNRGYSYDYNSVDWEIFREAFSDWDLFSNGETIEPGEKLSNFVNQIKDINVRKKLLIFFRDNADDVVFKYLSPKNTDKFIYECAQIIYYINKELSLEAKNEEEIKIKIKVEEENESIKQDTIELYKRDIEAQKLEIDKLKKRVKDLENQLEQQQSTSLTVDRIYKYATKLVLNERKVFSHMLSVLISPRDDKINAMIEELDKPRPSSKPIVMGDYVDNKYVNS